MKICDTCGEKYPACWTRGNTCPECLREILIHAVYEDEDDEDDEDYIVSEEGNDAPEGPEDDDLVTSDYEKFYEKGFEHKGPVVQCREGGKWAHKVKAYMDKQQFWPNVWYINERGDADLIDMYDALHSEDDS